MIPFIETPPPVGTKLHRLTLSLRGWRTTPSVKYIHWTGLDRQQFTWDPREPNLLNEYDYPTLEEFKRESVKGWPRRATRHILGNRTLTKVLLMKAQV